MGKFILFMMTVKTKTVSLFKHENMKSLFCIDFIYLKSKNFIALHCETDPLHPIYFNCHYYVKLNIEDNPFSFQILKNIEKHFL